MGCIGVYRGIKNQGNPQVGSYQVGTLEGPLPLREP